MAVTVGTREFRDRISKYLDLVAGGDEVIITDHGRERARVLPAGQDTTLERLVRDGKVQAPLRARRPLKPLVQATGPTMVPDGPVASDLIDRR